MFDKYVWLDDFKLLVEEKQGMSFDKFLKKKHGPTRARQDRKTIAQIVLEKDDKQKSMLSKIKGMEFSESDKRLLANHWSCNPENIETLLREVNMFSEYLNIFRNIVGRDPTESESSKIKHVVDTERGQQHLLEVCSDTLKVEFFNSLVKRDLKITAMNDLPKVTKGHLEEWIHKERLIKSKIKIKPNAEKLHQKVESDKKHIEKKWNEVMSWYRACLQRELQLSKVLKEHGHDWEL